MRCFAFRLFAALSFSLALSLPVHAVESLSAFAWPSLKSWNCTLDSGVNGELTRRQGLAKTIESSPQAADSDKIIWLKQVENYPTQSGTLEHHHIWRSARKISHNFLTV